MKLDVAVIANATDVYLVADADTERRDYGPFKFHGMFRIQDGKATVESEPGAESLQIMSGAIVPLMNLIREKFEVEALERMVQL